MSYQNLWTTFIRPVILGTISIIIIPVVGLIVLTQYKILFLNFQPSLLMWIGLSSAYIITLLLWGIITTAVIEFIRSNSTRELNSLGRYTLGILVITLITIAQPALFYWEVSTANSMYYAVVSNPVGLYVTNFLVLMCSLPVFRMINNKNK